MPSLHYLNPPPHPFWDFVANLEDHPFFAAYAQPPTNNNENATPAAENTSQSTPAAEASGSQRNAEKQPSVEDDNSDNEQPASKRGIGQSQHHHDKPEKTDNKDVPSDGEREWPFRGRGHHGPGPHPHHHHRHGGPGGHHRGPPPPPGFGFGFPPFGPFAPRRHGPPGPWGPPCEPPNTPPQHSHPGGPRRGPHGCGRRGRRAEGSTNNFDLGGFLNNLGNQLGIDLSSAAEGLGLDRFTDNNKNSEVDFTPRADVFDTPSNYIVHVSLPGAKKNDVGVDWDGENSSLRIAGVVHRPNVDEEMMKRLAVDGRKRENGVFEKSITLGTRRDPASINVAGITARMQDGVLIVTVPKVEKEIEKREVPITSAETSPVREEKNVRFESQPQTIVTEKAKDVEMDTRSETEKGDEEMYDGGEQLQQEEELPAYQSVEHGDDGESSASGEEGEYVKIDVD